MNALVPMLRDRLDRWQSDCRGDGALLRGYVEGRAEDPFRVFLERHGPLVWRVCRSVLGEEHAAEDAFQATFLALARSAGALANDRFDSVAGWLYRTARRAAMKA